ncbi:Transcriptional regulator containing a DNA-binding HTH domain and an aminotransferase domain (MocR family) and their eukaryotic orthologs [Hahella chejuensis KCTC 2396]|uniref:Transcriptional regulator containing a DNA-binding HTH domain and an aminotransferase domain (MocR family) and their eukaryotic orthologs n=2 Tax=Hahella chejuensis TaxID=158327 RepID=Q2S7B9_HAHCH|nr:Transcriptional regulator containing a DNA-binding HTH domain and an aminotransferase domain (MocR family) and their eukaryotic orthologs [Hahella chejuensis KCTC 2396]
MKNCACLRMNEAATGMSKKRYEEVAEAVAGRIRQGMYAVGDRIPGTRDLVEHFSVSVSTIMAAQRLLERQGWVEARPRSGYYVRRRNQEGAAEGGAALPKVTGFESAPTLVDTQQTIMSLVQATQSPRGMNFAMAAPATQFLPAAAMEKAFRAALRESGEEIEAYSFPPGALRLREAIVQRMKDAWCDLEPDDILITNGCHEALTLALRAVTQPGDVVAVESPTYFGLLQVIDALGLKALEIPADPKSGLSLEALQLALEQWPVKACVAMPNFSNPLGCLMPDERKEQLVRLLEVRGVPLIENDIYGELGFSGLRPRAAKSYDRAGGVLYCSSFSKSIAPGLRVGWMAPGRWLPQVGYLKFASTLACPSLPQMAVAHYLAQADFDRHLRRMRHEFAVHVERMTTAVLRHFPPGVRVSQPAGGFVLWVELAEGRDTVALYRKALAAGVSIAPGTLFSGDGDKYRHCLRLNCAAPWTAEAEDAIRQLGGWLRAG